MGWKENKNAYVSRYVKEKYIKVTVQLRPGDPKDDELLAAMKDVKSKNQFLKDMAYQGLKNQK